MVNPRLKKLLTTSLKLVLTGLALWIVFRKIDPAETWTIFKSASPFWLLAAFALFNFSKILSALRLNIFFKETGLQLPELYNLKVYYIGMFYNLFLPGGIGGDGYKVYLLNKHYKHPVKPLIQASLMDRFSGLIALLFLAVCFSFFPSIYPIFQDWSIAWLLWLGLVGLLPVWYIAVKLILPVFYKSLNQSNLQSLGVQGFQVVCALFILVSLGVDSLFPAYMLLFLISSVVAVLPFTIGGVGARELVFVLGHSYLGIDQNTAVAFSLLFFVITATSSMIGAMLKAEPIT